MSYEHYLKLKKRGPISEFLLNDQGIKIFPVCLNLRKFTHSEKNHFTLLNVSFELLFDIENYFSIGFDLYHYSHHQSNLTEKPIKKKLSIIKEPLYEYGNEEEFLPKVEMISTVKNEKEILNFLEKNILYYEEEQNTSIWKEFFKTWEKNKQQILDKNVNKNNINKVNWDTLFNLLNIYETNNI